MTFRCGVAVPQFYPDDDVEADAIVEFARTAEALAYDALWVQDEVLGTNGALDALTTLSFIASATSSIDLGVGVLLVPVMDPLQLAKSTATLDRLSGGRLIVGVGLGANADEYAAHGLDPRGRGARFEHVIASLLTLWSGSEDAAAHGPFDLTGAQVRPLPLQSPHPRLWFGGHAPAALDRAIRFGDGFLGAGSASVTDFASELDHLARHPSGRQLTVAKRVYIACEDYSPNARQRVHTWLDEHYGGPGLGETVAVAGSVDECRHQLEGLLTLGVDELILNFVLDERVSMERAARDIVPHLRRCSAPAS